MELHFDDIERVAKGMWSVYVKNIKRHCDSEVAQTLPEWEKAEGEDKTVWRAMAMRAYKEFREMDMIAS